MKPQIISQGAEAIIEKHGNEIVKKRISKSYRLKELDEKIRKLRTRAEAKILERAAKVIPVPKVLKSDEKSKEISMEFTEGKRLSDFLKNQDEKMQREICKELGKNIALLHKENIIHGDLTPGNLIYVSGLTDNIQKSDGNKSLAFSSQARKRGDIISNQSASEASVSLGAAGGKNSASKNKDFKIFFIDFGLSYISPKLEDKAVDLHLLREALEAGFGEKWRALFDSVKQGYSKNNPEAKKILERFTAVEKRGRYKRAS